MDFELPEELAEVQKLARDFSEKEIAPSAAKDDREHVFRKDLVVKMGELGFYGCLIPEAFGGNGLGFLAHTLISEEIARAQDGTLKELATLQQNYQTIQRQHQQLLALVERYKILLHEFKNFIPPAEAGQSRKD